MERFSLIIIIYKLSQYFPRPYGSFKKDINANYVTKK